MSSLVPSACIPLHRGLRFARSRLTEPACSSEPTNSKLHNFKAKPQNQTNTAHTHKRKVKEVDFQDAFISALVEAGRCARHKTSPNATARTSKTYQRFISSQKRSFCTSSHQRHPSEAIAYEVPREELQQLVHHYPFPTARPFERPKVRKVTPAPPPPLPTPDPPAPRKSPLIPLEGYQDLPQQSQDLITFINANQSNPTAIYNAYLKLPAPRPLQLPQKYIHKILNTLSNVPHKDLTSSVRYLSILHEARDCEIPLSIKHWTTAMSFTGRSVKQIISDTQLQETLALWNEMESQANLKADAGTFNVLLDIAVKADRFVLADMLLREMRTREIALDRYGRTGLIMYYGRKGDGDGIRRAYKDFVAAGEIVDTAVLNAVIAAFLQAGEPSQAELTFARMKLLAAKITRPKQPPTWWRERRHLGQKLLLKKVLSGEIPPTESVAISADAPNASPLSPNANSHPAPSPQTKPSSSSQPTSSSSTTARLTALQNAVPLGPDQKTYSMLLRHHCISSRNYRRAIYLLQELCSRLDLSSPHKIPGFAYLHLFSGFVLHGRQRSYGESETSVGGDEGNADWTPEQLQNWFEKLMDGLDEQARLTAKRITSTKGHRKKAAAPQDEFKYTETLRLEKGLVIAVIRAHIKTGASKQRVQEVWQMLREKWVAGKVSNEHIDEAEGWVTGVSRGR